MARDTFHLRFMACVTLLFGASLAIVVRGSAVAPLGNVIDATQVNSNRHRKTKKKVAKRKMKDSKSSVAPGTWGGDEIRLVIGADMSTLEYACAEGEISEKLMIDKNGNFDLKGVHMGRTPGPTYEDRPPKREAAHYKGHISGNTMSLKVTLTETNSVIGEFTLERGKTGRMHRCL